MEFLTQFFWYLIAFLVGAVVAWLIARATVEPTTEEEAFADLVGSRELGGRS